MSACYSAQVNRGEIEVRALAPQHAPRIINIIKAAESGKRPTDSVLKKFERVLSITLFQASTPSETRRIDSSTSRGMTLGDYLDDIR